MPAKFSEPDHPLLSDYRVVVSYPVHWGDQDAFGHVNNTVYLRWFESGRIFYFDSIGVSDHYEATKVGPIMASIRCDYRFPVTYPDTIQVGSRVSRIGRSSLAMDHAIVSLRRDLIVAEGTSTIVVYDYTKAKSTPVPDAIRRAIADREGRSFDPPAPASSG